MKQRLIYYLLGLCSLCFSACSEEITPSVDVTPEYGHLLQLTKESCHADTIICDWYKKYNCAVVYEFEDQDISWLWTSKLSNYYEKLDISIKEDSIILETMIKYIKDQMIDPNDDAVLKKALPYRIFITKEFHEKSDKTSAYVNSMYNGQDALIIGYLKSATAPFDEATFSANLNALYSKLVYNGLNPKPTDFTQSREACSSNLIILPENDAIENEPEWNTYPDFIPINPSTGKPALYDQYYHQANVLGYVTSYGKKAGQAPTYIPDEATDYGDYLSFITKQPGTYIRQRTQYYWRMAKRAGLLIKYHKETQNEDLIATQNANFPDDKVTLEDFDYDESRDE